MEALRAVVVVLSPLPELWRRVSRCISPQGHVVLGAATVEDARRRAVHPDVIAIDGQFLARIAWRGRELAETIEPERPVPLLALVRRDDHRPPRGLDLSRAGIVALYEPFQAAELAMVVNFLRRRARPE
jgi:DNA-binding response OmpR family regulator